MKKNVPDINFDSENTGSAREQIAHPDVGGLTEGLLVRKGGTSEQLDNSENSHKLHHSMIEMVTAEELVDILGMTVEATPCVVKGPENTRMVLIKTYYGKLTFEAMGDASGWGEGEYTESIQALCEFDPIVHADYFQMNAINAMFNVSTLYNEKSKIKMRSQIILEGGRCVANILQQVNRFAFDAERAFREMATARFS
ncbi:hypothetical protein [Alteromonas gilva]|uniref:Uncharacterized protein n=1 Tax=Alteromonas gilva TaxID=2987522 RepID=A0ABT5L7C6_9ALTE|nr:hypothetical protein [Alteromonas gilva]MDC8832969.1 hypothetical protein [Alteromonas gilva]